VLGQKPANFLAGFCDLLVARVNDKTRQGFTLETYPCGKIELRPYFPVLIPHGSNGWYLVDYLHRKAVESAATAVPQGMANDSCTLFYVRELF
jgi:hypothetical protein